MEYKIQHIPIKSNTRSGRKIVPTSLTIHGTENPKSTAQNERDNLARPDNERVASFHIAIDDKQAVECIPLIERAIHAGSTRGNDTSLSIEICESGNRQKTIENAVILSAKMLHERKWDIDKLVRHYDWSRKTCPKIMSNNDWKLWKEFKQNVKKELDKLNKPVVVKEHFGEAIYKSLEAKGLAPREKRFDDKLTRAEAFVLIDDLSNWVLKQLKK